MSKKREEKWKQHSFFSRSPPSTGVHQSDNWLPQLAQVAKHFNRQYQGETFELPRLSGFLLQLF